MQIRKMRSKSIHVFVFTVEVNSALIVLPFSSFAARKSSRNSLAHL